MEVEVVGTERQGKGKEMREDRKERESETENLDCVCHLPPSS